MSEILWNVIQIMGTRCGEFHRKDVSLQICKKACNRLFVVCGQVALVALRNCKSRDSPHPKSGRNLLDSSGENVSPGINKGEQVMANSSVVSSAQSDVTSDVVPYEVRHVVATFDNVSLFEDAFEMLEQARFHRSRLSMIASHDAVIKRLGHLYTPTGEHLNEDAFPTALFTDRHDIVGGRTLAIGLPVYIGGAATGLAVVATGGTLAFAALIAAAGAAAGGGIGSIIANALSKHHADYLAKQLAMGSLLLGVDVDTSKQEDDAIYLLKKAGGKNVNAHTITRYWDPRRAILNDFDPYPYVGMTGYGL